MATTKTEYLLPCACGQKLAIDRSQAGLAVRCDHCGAELTIPTLRGFAQLETVPTEAEVGAEWGVRQAVLFLGAVIAGIGLLAVLVVWLASPIFPQEYHDAMIETAGSTIDIDQMTISQTFELWRELKQSPDNSAVPEYLQLMADHRDASALYRQRITVALGVLIVGGLVLGAGLLVPKA
ncbi:MAG: hypothetical protein ABUL64_01800, partial [Singulisphaera sp.]